MHLALVVGWYLVVQTLEGFVLVPRIVGRSVGMHPVTVIVALLIGGDLLGFLGLLVAVPLAAVVQVFLRDGLAAYRRSPLYAGPASGREGRCEPRLTRAIVPRVSERELDEHDAAASAVAEPEPRDAAEEPEERATTPFDHPFFLPALLIVFTLWFGYDGWLNADFDPKWISFNRWGFFVLLAARGLLHDPGRARDAPRQVATAHSDSRLRATTLSPRIGFTPSKIGSTWASTT